MARRLKRVLGWTGLLVPMGCVPAELRLAGEEGGTDATADVRAEDRSEKADAPRDASHDAGAGADADASPEDATAGDSPLDTGPVDGGAKPPILCGDASCAVPGTFCCFNMELSPSACLTTNPAGTDECESLGGALLYCASRADCPEALPFCCLGPYLGEAQCETKCNAPNHVLCDPEAIPSPCTLPDVCEPGPLEGFDSCQKS